jgi:8-oxo-dGTP pyrophosphatase MutT (NUDIX family)
MTKPQFGEFSPIMVTPFFTLERAESLSPAAGHPYYRLAERDSVICCVLDQTDKFIFIKQYRPSLETATLETPAGAIEPGETQLDAARRELKEEVGITCPLLPVGSYFRLMMNRVTSKEYLFFGMFPEHCASDQRESGIDIARIARSEVLGMALAGGYQQLAGVGLLTLAGDVLGLDIWRDSLEKVEAAFRTNTKVDWFGGR